MNYKEIRWKQRFENFENAFSLLEEAVDDFSNLSKLEKEGLIQRFEYTFELSWKTLKDYLESQGVEAKIPREVIKQAFKNELISDGDEGEYWLEMLDRRNQMAHHYDEKTFNENLEKIKNLYFDLIKQVYETLKKQQ